MPLSAQLNNFMTTTSILAQSYYNMGVTYHAIPVPMAGLRNIFTVSVYRELPDLITLFGMIERVLLNARDAEYYGDGIAMYKEMALANGLLFEASCKVECVERYMGDTICGCGELEEDVKDLEEGLMEFRKWKRMLPACCGMLCSF